MTAIRLEPTGSNTVHKAGDLCFPSGTRRPLVLPHEDWDVLERLVKAAESELASWVEDDRAQERRSDR